MYILMVANQRIMIKGGMITNRNRRTDPREHDFSFLTISPLTRFLCVCVSIKILKIILRIGGEKREKGRREDEKKLGRKVGVRRGMGEEERKGRE